ncbi:MAG TPA: ABC transporter permease [Nocardioidaceae bacterium]|nr:ABC transporter permease [Nocardioidaceae bacterium]
MTTGPSSTLEAGEPQVADDDRGTAPATGESTGASVRQLVIQPVVVLLVMAGVAVYVSTATLNPTEAGLLNIDSLVALTIEHLQITAVTAVIVVAIGLPLGILLTRPWARYGRPPVVVLANLGQAAPSVGLLVLVAGLMGVGFRTAIVGLSIYGILPTLRNTMTGLEQVDRTLIESARGMGMSARATLARVELPMAVPVILTGIRLSLVLIVGTAALAPFIGGGGLGQLIITGVNLQLDKQLIVGAVLIASLALLIDWVGRVVETFARPKGLS